MGWVGLVWGVGAPPPYAFSCSPPGAPFLHIAQNKEDRHHCFCEGDPGRGLIGGRALDPTLALQHPSARAVLAHTHKLLPHWPWAFQEESKGLLPSAKEPDCRGPLPGPLGAHQCLCHATPRTPSLHPWKPWTWRGPDAPARCCCPSQRRQLVPWPSPGCHPSCIFFYLSTEWTLHTLIQGGYTSVLASVGGTQG